MNLLISIAFNYPMRGNNLKIKNKTQFNKKLINFVDEYKRQNQEIRERLKENLFIKS